MAEKATTTSAGARATTVTQEAPATTACSTALATTGMRATTVEDEVSFEPMTAPVLVDLPAGTVTSDVSSETISLVEVVIATIFDEVIGDSADNRLVGLRARPTARRRRARPHRGRLWKRCDERRGGIDAACTWKAESVTVDLLAGFGEGSGSDTLVAIENVIGSAFSDYLRGDSLPNLLEAFGSDDILEGRGGDDALDGGEGADAGDGGDGSDNCVAVEFRTSCES